MPQQNFISRGNILPLDSLKEWLGLEGTSRITKLQPPCCRQDHQPLYLILHEAAQGLIQPGLGHLQGCGNTASLSNNMVIVEFT